MTSMRRLFTAVALCALPFGGTAAQPILGVASSPAGTLAYNISAPIAKLIQEKANLPARLQTYGGTATYLPLIDRGEQDLGVTNALEIVLAAKGEDTFQGQPNTKLRMLTIVFPFRPAMFVKKASPLRTLADLKGKRFAAGFPAQTIIPIMANGVFATAGFTMADLIPVPTPNIVRGADDFVKGDTDFFFFALGGGKVQEVDAAVGGIRAIPVEDSPGALAAMRKYVPPAYIETIAPRPGLIGIVEPTKIMTYDYTLAVGAHVADATVYAIAKALAENHDSLVAQFPPYREFAPEKMAKPSEVPYHAGAIKYYTERGWWPPKG